MKLNKYTSFSICHLMAMIQYHKDTRDGTDIIFWGNLKKILESCELSKLMKSER